MRTDDELDIVRFALALHLRIDPEYIIEEQRLKEDLSLDPLDLVLVALRLEEVGTSEFPVDSLANVSTVADFVDAVRAWCRMTPSDRASTLPPPRPESGIRLAEESGAYPARARAFAS